VDQDNQHEFAVQPRQRPEPTRGALRQQRHDRVPKRRHRHTWVQTGSGIGGKDAYLLMTTPQSDSTVFCGTRSGLYKSTNMADLGRRLAGLRLQQGGADYHCRRPAHGLCECRDNAVFKSTDLGGSWVRCPEFLSCGMICSFASYRAVRRALGIRRLGLKQRRALQEHRRRDRLDTERQLHPGRLLVCSRAGLS